MNTESAAPFRQWLSTVTDSLPTNVVQIVAAEFENHYLDTVEALLDEGFSEKEAHKQSLANLGEAATISRGLKDVHLGHRHYKTAALASLLILVVLLFFPAFIDSFLAASSIATQVGQICTGLLLAGLTAYVLNTVRRLLIWRFALQKLDKLFKIIIIGYLVWLAADIVSLALYNAPLYIGSLRALREAINSFDTGLIAAAWLGQIGLGAAGMALAASLWSAKDNLYRIGKPLAICLALMAGPIGLASLAVNMGLLNLVLVLNMCVILGHILIWPVITMLFVRAIFRPPNAPPPQLI